eukprot:2542215-Amphidinium_carterae.2
MRGSMLCRNGSFKGCLAATGGSSDRAVTFLAAVDTRTRCVFVFAMPLTRKGSMDFATAKFVEWP